MGVRSGLTVATLIVAVSGLVSAVIDPECDGTIFPDVRFMEGSCYWVNVDVGGIFDWSAADGNCRADGGYLATIANVRVQKFLEDIVAELKGSDPIDLDLWIGYKRDMITDVHAWIEPNAVTNYTNWLIYNTNDTLDEPRITPTRLCVSMYHSPGKVMETNVTDYQQFAWGEENCLENKGFICKLPVNPKGACQKALISGEYYLTYPTANSALVLDTGNSSVYMAALGTRAEDTGYGAWSTEDLHSLNYHIEVDLGGKRVVTGIWTQGRNDPNETSAEWVRSYYISYSVNRQDWDNYRHPENRDVPENMRGNWDRDTISKNTLDFPFLAAYVRIIPIGYSRIQKMEKYSMRVEVIGCRLPDDGIASADRFSSFSTPYPQVYRADVYSHVNTGSFPHLHSSTVDQSISTGTFIDSDTEHPAWSNFYRVTATSIIYKGVVRVLVNRQAIPNYVFPCEREIQQLIPSKWSIVSIHSSQHSGSEASYSGEQVRCPLLQYTLYSTFIDSCEYLCSSDAGFSQVFVDTGYSPYSYGWKLVEISLKEPMA